MTTWRRSCSDATQVHTSLGGLALTTRFKQGAGEVRWHDQAMGFVHLAHAQKKAVSRSSRCFGKSRNCKKEDTRGTALSHELRDPQTAGKSLAREDAVGECCRLQHHSPCPLCPRTHTNSKILMLPTHNFSCPVLSQCHEEGAGAFSASRSS